MAIDYIILALYVVGMVAIAIYTKNRSKSVDDFLLAGKNGLNGWMSAFAYGTTYFSAVIFIGLDRYRKCNNRFAFCLDGFGKKN